MHGQNMASGNGVTWALCSPPPVLPGCGSMRWCASAFSVPVEADLSTRPFALLQRRLTFRSVSAAGSTLLACIFKAIPTSPPGSFDFALPPAAGFLFASRGTINALNPLPSPISELSACFRASAPLRDLSIPRARSAQPDSKRKSLSLRVARSSFAPRNARNNFLFTSATDHRSRSATSRQTLCPSNLLEPSS